MSVVVTLNVNSKINGLVFDADDFGYTDLGDGSTVLNVLEPGTDEFGMATEPKVIAAVRDWSAVAIDPGKPADLIEQVRRAVKGDAAAAPCEKCADRETRLRDSITRLSQAAQAQAPGNG